MILIAPFPPPGLSYRAFAPARSLVPACLRGVFDARPMSGDFPMRLRGVAEPATPHGVPPARWHLIIQDMMSVTPAAVISRATDMTYAAMISTAMTHGLIWLYLMKARSATN